MFRPLVLLLVSSLAVACPAPTADPLAAVAADAHPLTEAQLADLSVPRELVRVLPRGPETPVFALIDADGTPVGFQLEVAAEHASLQAHGLRRVARRLDPELPAAVWLTDSESALVSLAVMTRNPVTWHVLATAGVPENVDFETVRALLTATDGPPGVLHAVGSDWVEVEFAAPAAHLASLVLSHDAPPMLWSRVENSLAKGRLRLPIE